VSLPLFDGYHSLSCTHPFSLLAIHELVTKPLSVNQHRLFLMHAHAHRIFSALRGRNHLQAHTMNKNDSATFIIHMIILAATVTHHHHPFIAASSQRSNCDPPDASSGTQCFTFCSLTSRHSEMSGLGFLSLFSTHCLLSRGLRMTPPAQRKAVLWDCCWHSRAWSNPCHVPVQHTGHHPADRVHGMICMAQYSSHFCS
jgi:hypothetical protein